VKTGDKASLRNNSASLRASMRSPLLPDFRRLVLRRFADQHASHSSLQQIVEPRGMNSFLEVTCRVPRMRREVEDRRARVALRTA